MVARLIPVRPAFLPRDRSASLRARSARLLAPRRLHFATLVSPAGALDSARDYSACDTRALHCAPAPLVFGCRQPIGRLPLLSAARSLRSLACSGKARPLIPPCPVSDALPMVARLIRDRAPLGSRPASACNRLSPAYRQAPLIVACGVKWRQRYLGLRVVPSLPLIDHRYLAFAFAQCPALNYSAAVLRRWGRGHGARSFGVSPCSLPSVGRSRSLRARGRGSRLTARAPSFVGRRD